VAQASRLCMIKVRRAGKRSASRLLLVPKLHLGTLIGPMLCLGEIGAPSRLDKRMPVSHSRAAQSPGEAELRNQVRSQAGAWEREGTVLKSSLGCVLRTDCCPETAGSARPDIHHSLAKQELCLQGGFPSGSLGTRNKSFWWHWHLVGAWHRLEACATKDGAHGGPLHRAIFL
jgi:hypothetical protein